MVESSSVSANFTEPVSRPNASPAPPPMARPANARPALTFTCVHSSPEAVSVHAALTTSTGAGSTRVLSQPSDDAICQKTMSPTGTSHGTSRWTTPMPKFLNTLPPLSEGVAGATVGNS